MNTIRWIGAGAIGGLVGALIWGAITYFLSAEIGWIAWGIGALVGVCVRLGAGSETEGATPGAGAIGISAGAILLGKYFAAMMLLGGTSIEIDAPTPEDLKLMMTRSSGTVYETWAEVPPNIKADAEARWNALTPEERTDMLKMLHGKGSITAFDVFQESFSPYDILWFLLAAGTAYRLGSGTGTED
jgi:hypothetical protein